MCLRCIMHPPYTRMHAPCSTLDCAAPLDLQPSEARKVVVRSLSWTIRACTCSAVQPNGGSMGISAPMRCHLYRTRSFRCCPDTLLHALPGKAITVITTPHPLPTQRPLAQGGRAESQRPVQHARGSCCFLGYLRVRLGLDGLRLLRFSRPYE